MTDSLKHGVHLLVNQPAVHEPWANVSVKPGFATRILGHCQEEFSTLPASMFTIFRCLAGDGLVGLFKDSLEHVLSIICQGTGIFLPRLRTQRCTASFFSYLETTQMASTRGVRPGPRSGGDLAPSMACTHGRMSQSFCGRCEHESH